MNVVQAVIYGFVEGFTEFLPVSSTAHLIFLSKFFNLPQSEFVSFFEVFIQSGAILAVVILYCDYIRKHIDLAKSVFISFVPTAIVGFFAHDLIKSVFFESTNIIIFSLIGIGIVFIIVEALIARKVLTLTKGIDHIPPAHAVLIGLCQALAIVPGVSRAGSVIVSMMLLKYKRSEAALYSFLLAVPTILGASVLDFAKTDFSIFNGSNVMLLIVGFVTSFVSALIFIRWFIQFLQKNTLTPFGFYRIALGAILLMIFQHL